MVGRFLPMAKRFTKGESSFFENVAGKIDRLIKLPKFVIQIRACLFAFFINLALLSEKPINLTISKTFFPKQHYQTWITTLHF